MAFRIARHERPFTIEAIAILPEHLHVIWTLPTGDSDFSGRWRRIEAHFTHRLVAARVPVKRHCNGGYALWQRRFWEHTIRNEFDFERHVDYVHFNPVKHKLVRRVRAGHIRRFTCLSGAVCCQPIGRATSTSP